MKKFQVGATVVRTTRDCGNVKVGQLHRVVGVGWYYVQLEGEGVYRFDANCFELVTDPFEELQRKLPPWETVKKTFFESDPNGTPANATGAKLDAGKVRPSLIIEGMARAIWAVAEVATFGANKYTDGGWIEVPKGQERYADAQYRHVLKRAKGEQVDPDSQKLHLAHDAWNALAKLDLFLREQEGK